VSPWARRGVESEGWDIVGFVVLLGVGLEVERMRENER
jgi:hypothetical protein